jgi:hypothetical protein
MKRIAFAAAVAALFASSTVIAQNKRVHPVTSATLAQKEFLVAENRYTPVAAVEAPAEARNAIKRHQLSVYKMGVQAPVAPKRAIGSKTNTEVERMQRVAPAVE